MERILKLLSENAKLTNRQIAAMVGASEEEVAAQIAQFEKEGVIKGYKALIDWDKTDRELVTAIIELRVTPKQNQGFEEIAQTIMDFREVDSVYLMSGGFDLAVIVKGKTFQDIAMFVAYRLSPLESVLSTATHFILRKYKERGVNFSDGEDDERRITTL